MKSVVFSKVILWYFKATASLCITSQKGAWYCCCCNHLLLGIRGWSALGGANMCLQFSMTLIYHAAFNVCSLVYEI